MVFTMAGSTPDGDLVSAQSQHSPEMALCLQNQSLQQTPPPAADPTPARFNAPVQFVNQILDVGQNVLTVFDQLAAGVGGERDRLVVDSFDPPPVLMINWHWFHLLGNR